MKQIVHRRNPAPVSKWFAIYIVSYDPIIYNLHCFISTNRHPAWWPGEGFLSNLRGSRSRHQRFDMRNDAAVLAGAETQELHPFRGGFPLQVP